MQLQPFVAVGMELLCKRFGISRRQGGRRRNIGLLGKVNEPKTKEYIEIHGIIAEIIAHRDKKNKGLVK